MFRVTEAEAAAIQATAADTALLDLLDLLRQESARLIEALERVTADLRALEERATAAGEALAGVDGRLDRIERRLGIREP